ncbi:MAG: 16S rRNA (cytosine(1402)-N(4))-methyltransferase RsmH [Candidatus Daviesbacteria bacterium]|nr:MAG: 16S rRNA (cytosine(1402)-N(4))-methyltransferase RsmH [Candidatus Daviesbacteria bacterium]
MKTYHKSVLLKETLVALHIQKGAWYLDCTLGDGGHSLEILKQGSKLVGIDVDPQALERASQRFEQEGIPAKQYQLIEGNFRDLTNLIAQTGIDQKFLGVIFDLGVSSLQLETPERGFSFLREGPLDMRMDPKLSVTALDLIRGLNKGELNELFTKLGEEKFARKLAAAVVSARPVIKTTGDLARVIEKEVGRSGKIHPATKIFQALRIAVNDELNALKEGLEASLKVVEKDGLVLVISFHSLEDRAVKNIFRHWQNMGLGESSFKKPLLPSEREINQNPRARSAKLRVFQKLVS